MYLRLGSLHREPRWIDVSAMGSFSVPESVRGWLLDTNSLTWRLRQICQESFCVRVLRQNWARPMHSERRLLELRDDRRARIREVQLICRGRPWVFARTVMPMATLQGATRRYSLLGTKPLGAVLFADRSWRRRVVQIARIDRDHYFYNAALNGARSDPEVIWGRRALYCMDSKALLVNEVFLPPVMSEHL